MGDSGRAGLLEACRVLFAGDPEPAFLHRVRPDGLRSAWRRRALATHPDRVTEPDLKQLHTERFLEASRAYELLRAFVDRRDQPPRRPRTVPVRSRGDRPRATAGAPRPQRGTPPAAAGLPRRRLRLGEYLCHVRLISLRDLIEAVVWQRRQRERFGEISRRWGLLDEERSVLLLVGRAPGERIGAAARRLGLLSETEVRVVLGFQRRRQPPLGSYFVLQGLLSPPALGAQLARLAAHNASCAGR